MARQNLGRVAMMSKGEYSSSATYENLDIVTYNGSSYVCKQTSTGNLPTNTEYFDILAEKGTDGEDGQQGTPATINGVNALIINASNGISLTQAGAIAIISGLSLQTDISDINALIPTQATTSNQLADKSFVNSSISTNTAFFIGTFNSVQDLENYSGTVTNNDYAFVVTTDSAGNTLYDRYKYNGTQWLFEYELNNSSFTANQWASINSGATATNIGQITTNKNAIGTLANLTTTEKSSLVGATNEINAGKVDKTSFVYDSTTDTLTITIA